jgi:tRNA acetyltransferase TAN1
MNPENKVDLTNPELTIIVEVIKTVCCLSVVPDYALYRKYNLQEVVKEDAPKADAADKRADQKATDQGDSADVVKAEEQTDKQAEDIKVPENDKLVEAATEDKK